MTGAVALPGGAPALEPIRLDVGGKTLLIDRAVIDDPRFAYYASKLSDSRVAERDRASSYSRFLDLMFGGEDATLDAMDAYAEDNGGRASVEGFSKWLVDAISAASAGAGGDVKNS